MQYLVPEFDASGRITIETNIDRNAFFHIGKQAFPENPAYELEAPINDLAHLKRILLGQNLLCKKHNFHTFVNKPKNLVLESL